MRSRSLAAALLVGALLAGVPARADEAAERRARAMFKEATRLYDDGDFSGALDLYRQAYGEWSNVKILMNIGTTLQRMGRHAEAADVFEKVLADPAADAKKRPAVEKSLAELERKIAKLHIEVNQPGASIVVDGTAVGESPLAGVVRVEPGSHAIVAEKPGVPAAVANLNVAAGEDRRLELTLAEPAPDHTSDGATGAGGETQVGDAATTSGGSDAGSALGSGQATTTVVRRREPTRAALLRTDLDGQGRGAVAVVGGSLRLGGRVDFTLAALIGARQGIYTGLTLLLATGAWRPRLNAGMPLFLSDGTLLGLHGGAGLEWAASRAVGLFVDFGVTYFLSGTERYETLAYVPSLGMQLRF